MTLDLMCLAQLNSKFLGNTSFRAGLRPLSRSETKTNERPQNDASCLPWCLSDPCSVTRIGHASLRSVSIFVHVALSSSFPEGINTQIGNKSLFPDNTDATYNVPLYSPRRCAASSETTGPTNCRVSFLNWERNRHQPTCWLGSLCIQ